MVAPPPLFVARADWTRTDEYPAPEDEDPHRWAWEFLRRNGRYEAEYAALQVNIHSVEHQEFSEDEIEEWTDAFCLRWYIDYPADPARGWPSAPLSQPVLGERGLRVVRPLPHAAGNSDNERYQTSTRGLPVTRRHVLVRLSLDHDLTKQLQVVEERFNAIQAAENEYRRSIYQSDKTPPRRAEVRVSKSLHFVLRSLDAIALSRPHLRDDLPDDFDALLSKEDSPIPAFGHHANEWTYALSRTIAQQFTKDSRAGKFESGTEARPAQVLKWMRRAYYFAAEKGYIQIATGELAP